MNPKEQFQIIQELQKSIPDDTREYLNTLARELKESIENPLLRMKLEGYAFELLFMAYGRGFQDCVESINNIQGGKE